MVKKQIVDTIISRSAIFNQLFQKNNDLVVDNELFRLPEGGQSSV